MKLDRTGKKKTGNKKTEKTSEGKTTSNAGYARLRAMQKKAKQKAMERTGFVSFQDLQDGKTLIFPLNGKLGEREYKVKKKTFPAYPFHVQEFVLVSKEGKIIKQGKIDDNDFDVNGSRGKNYFEMPTSAYTQGMLKEIEDTSQFMMYSDYQGRVGQNDSHMYDVLILDGSDSLVTEYFES